MRKVFVAIFVSMVIILSSCEKDDITQPVEVEFEFSMESFHMEGDSKAASGFDVDEGTIIISEIQFDGRRNQGEDYYFTSDFNSPLMAQMHNRVMNQNVSYDVPQGIYDRIDIHLSLGDSAQFALQLQGRFQRGPLDEVLVDFQYAFKEQINIRARNNQGNEQVVFTQDSGLKAKVIFDVPHLFQFISMKMIQNAEITKNGNASVLEINNEKNTDIFNLMVTRLDNSMRVVFE
ncbi:MAG: hypothetical protein C0597_00685 [Marinilabiliales bacterium]|nr:MAG: hypothetical protein C0597_00685 [Marinilabiliales bacterium]